MSQLCKCTHRSSSSHACTYKVENSRKFGLLRHSFSVCVWTCLRWMNSTSQVCPNPSLHSLAPVSLPRLLPPTCPPFCSPFLFVLVVCFRLFLLGKHAPFSWVRFCHSVCQSYWPHPHRHSSTCPNTHLKQAQKHKWPRHLKSNCNQYFSINGQVNGLLQLERDHFSQL